MSFLLDPPLLVAAGAVIERLDVDEATAQKLRIGTLTTTIGVSLALYANAPGLRAIWGPFGARSGREFMLTSGLARVDLRRMSRRNHALALSLFLIYPLWLALGRGIAGPQPRRPTPVTRRA